MKSTDTKRLCIYFFYDKEGVVDDYVIYYLQKIRERYNEICVVVNGLLSEDSEKALHNITNRLIVRDNEGFDAWAYKEALESYGYEYIRENFDEVLLNNFTVFGPIGGSFLPMFEKMDSRVCDFWGHCRYYPAPNQRVKNFPVPEHLMSYFIVFRKTILITSALQDYFNSLAPIVSYDEARLHHEFRLARFFETRGFISDAYISSEVNSTKISCNTPVYDAWRQLKEEHSPLLKRKVLFVSGNKSEFKIADINKIVKYIHKHHLFDLRLIFKNLIRTKSFAFGTNCSSWKLFRGKFFGAFLRIGKYKRKWSERKQFIDFNFIKGIMK